MDRGAPSLAASTMGTAGVWARVLAALQTQADVRGELGWLLYYLDSTIVRAHQHAAVAKGGPQQEALSRSRGGFSTKVHVRAEQYGRPLVLLVSPGQAADLHYVAPLLQHGAVPRPGPGRPAPKPDRVVGDKGYRYRVVRNYLQRRGIGRVIPGVEIRADMVR
jgi:hypothetical protein